MEIYKILLELVKNPKATKPYKDLAETYKLLEKENEFKAFMKLIEIKFKKNESNN